MMAVYTRKRKKGKRTVLDNDDLLEEILLRLPPSHVIRFKGVCKHWEKLISSCSFRLRHSCLSSNSSRASSPQGSMTMLQVSKKLKIEDNRLVVLLDHNGSVPPAISAKTDPDLSFPFIFGHDVEDIPKDERCFFLVHNSSNGLLLITKIETKKGFITGHFICNPLTEEYIELPPLKFDDIEKEAEIAELWKKLVFDPVDSSHYKVISVNGILRKPHNEDFTYIIVHIYSSKSQGWEVAKYFNYCPELASIKNSAAVVNGVLCWPPPPESINGEHVLSFDLESLRIKSLSFPSSEFRCWVYFGESRGHLYLVEISENMPENYSVWEIKNIRDYCCSWVLKFQFRLEGPVNLLHIHRDDEEDCFQIFFVLGNLIYSLKSTEFNTTRRLEYVAVSGWRVGDLVDYWCVIKYDPTLFPLACQRSERTM